MKLLFYLVLMALSLNTCVTTKGWESTDGPDFYKAKYEEFSGRKIIEKQLDKDDRLKLIYVIENHSGALALNVKSSERSLLLDKKMNGKITDSLIIVSNDKKEKITIALTGDKAVGGFHLSFEGNKD